ncbi:hypothetical protein RIF29_00699 [Crotalaria pallida]|uniref:Uncharacterized protein n=1 Tax=Crotalaria pallida TaxID=3830 RepID=A0AAN9IW03_CROPI
MTILSTVVTFSCVIQLISHVLMLASQNCQLTSPLRCLVFFVPQLILGANPVEETRVSLKILSKFFLKLSINGCGLQKFVKSSLITRCYKLLQSLQICHQEVSRLLTGLNCGKALETIDLPESVSAASVEHGFDLHVRIQSIFPIRFRFNITR